MRNETVSKLFLLLPFRWDTHRGLGGGWRMRHRAVFGSPTESPTRSCRWRVADAGPPAKGRRREVANGRSPTQSRRRRVADTESPTWRRNLGRMRTGGLSFATSVRRFPCALPLFPPSLWLFALCYTWPPHPMRLHRTYFAPLLVSPACGVPRHLELETACTRFCLKNVEMNKLCGTDELVIGASIVDSFLVKMRWEKVDDNENCLYKLSVLNDENAIDEMQKTNWCTVEEYTELQIVAV